MFSKACQYAIRATLHIAATTATDERVGVTAIAKATGSPEAFTAKVLQKLVKAGLIGSMKGPGGGFTLTEARAKKVKISAIVDAIDGDSVYTGCALGLSKCSSEKPCPIHDRFKSIRDDLSDLLERTSVHDLSIGLGEGIRAHVLKG
ncbi:MAG: Rrf2 family transcriptional regulator [Flavobacteriales bacterium]|nr:Rrf2 family transcriptional regulator [Flavobacteriales bacterium]